MRCQHLPREDEPVFTGSDLAALLGLPLRIARLICFERRAANVLACPDSSVHDRPGHHGQVSEHFLLDPILNNGNTEPVKANVDLDNGVRILSHLQPTLAHGIANRHVEIRESIRQRVVFEYLSAFIN